MSAGDEVGSGVGESTPMQSTSKKTVILEPFRIMNSSQWVTDIEPGVPFKLTMPTDEWPGTVYSSLIAIHWEIIFEFEQKDGRRIMWVEPVIIPQSDTPTEIDKAPVISGRAELSNF